MMFQFKYLDVDGDEEMLQQMHIDKIEADDAEFDLNYKYLHSLLFEREVDTVNFNEKIDGRCWLRELFLNA